MAQILDSLAARLGSQVGQGVGSSAASLNEMIQQRIADLRQERLQDAARQRQEEFLRTALPEKDKEKAAGLSYGSEKLIQDYLKSSAEARGIAQLQKLYGSVDPNNINPSPVPYNPGNNMGAPENIEAGIQPSEIAQATFNKQKQAAQSFKEKVQAEQQGKPNEFVQTLQKLGKTIAPETQATPELPFKIETPEQQAFFDSLDLGTPEQQKQFQQEIQEAPIREDLPEQEKRKAAIQYFAIKKIADKAKRQGVSNEEFPQAMTAKAIVADNPQVPYEQFTGEGLTVDQYQRAMQHINEQRKENRMSFSKMITDGEGARRRGHDLQLNIASLKALNKAGANFGTFQKLADFLKVPVEFRGSKIEIADKILNDLVVKSPDLSRGRATNMLMGFISRTKPTIYNSKAGIDALAEVFDLAGAVELAYANSIDEIRRPFGNNPLPQNFDLMVSDTFENKINRLEDIYKKRFEDRFGLKMEESPYTLSDTQLQKGVVDKSFLPQGAVYEDGGNTFMMWNGKPVKLERS